MYFLSPRRTQKLNRRAVAWALLSQSIWLPAFISVTHDSIVSTKNDYRPIDLSMSSTHTRHFNTQDINLRPKPNSEVSLLAYGSKQPASSGILLNSLPPHQPTYSSRSSDSSPRFPQSPVFFSPPSRSPSTLSLVTRSDYQPKASLSPSRSSDILRHFYNQSDLLGGVITLGDLNEPLIPPIARAQMAKYLRSGDPLSPIPGYMREPMRQALQSLMPNNLSSPLPSHPSHSSEIDQARVVHVPSTRLKRSADVPLALQSDGSVDILNVPSDPAVVDEIKIWSTKQSLPSKGRIVPAVVHLHPLTVIDQNPPSDPADQRSSSTVLPGRKTEAPPRSTAFQPSIPSVETIPSAPAPRPHQVDPVEPPSVPPTSIPKISSETPLSEVAPIQSRGDVQ